MLRGNFFRNFARVANRAWFTILAEKSRKRGGFNVRVRVHEGIFALVDLFFFPSSSTHREIRFGIWRTL